MVAATQEIVRIPEFHGPEQLGQAIEALTNPEVDGAVVRQLVDAEVLADLFPASLLDNLRSFQGTVASDGYNKIKGSVPQFREVEAITVNNWQMLSFAGNALVKANLLMFFKKNAIETHIDVGHARMSSQLYGPVSMSLGLRGWAAFGLERLPRSDFTDSNGRLDRHKTEKVFKTVKHRPLTDLRSQLEQGAGDLIVINHPTTVHGTEPSENRMALVIEQIQEQDKKK